MNNLYPLGKFCKVRRGASPRPIGDPRYFGGNVGWIRISDVTKSNKFLNKTEQYLSSLGEKKSVRVDKGDLVMSICGTIGKPIIINIPSCIHDGFVQLYDLKGIDTEYLYYLLQYHEKDLERKGQPGTQVNLNSTIVSNFIAYVPSEREQKKIALILSSYDELLTNLQLQLSKNQKVITGIMHDLFTYGVDNDGKLRPSPEQYPNLCKESEMGLIPTEWDCRPFHEMTEFISYGFTNPMPDSKDGPYMITAKDVKDGSIDFANCRKTTVEAFNNLLTDKSRPIKNDILLTKDGTLGRLAIVEKENICINQSVAIIRPSDNLEATYLKTMLETDEYQDIMLSEAGGSTIKHLYITTIDKMRLKFPSKKEERIRIYDRVNCLKERIELEKLEIEKVKKMKIGSMQDLLTGKVKV